MSESGRFTWMRNRGELVGGESRWGVAVQVTDRKVPLGMSWSSCAVQPGITSVWAKSHSAVQPATVCCRRGGFGLVGHHERHHSHPAAPGVIGGHRDEPAGAAVSKVSARLAATAALPVGVMTASAQPRSTMTPVQEPQEQSGPQVHGAGAVRIGAAGRAGRMCTRSAGALASMRSRGWFRPLVLLVMVCVHSMVLRGW